MSEQIPEQSDNGSSYLVWQKIEIPCDGGRCFEMEQPEAAKLMDGRPLTFAHVKEDFKIELTPVSDKSIRVELIPGKKYAGKCHEVLGGTTILPLHFPDMLLRVTLQCPLQRVKNPPQTWLCLDIGNTRTCALIDLPDSEIAFYKVDNRENGEFGIFNSLCVAQAPEKAGKAFVRIGKPAAALRRKNPAKGYTVSLSTPKRFFWDDEPNPMIRWFRNDKPETITPTSTPAGLSGFRGGMPTRQLFMQGAVLELLEQAEKTVGSLIGAQGSDDEPTDDFKKRVRTLRPDVPENDTIHNLAATVRSLNGNRSVTDLVCTCPAAWIQAQRHAYRKLIRNAVDLYSENRCPPLKFHLACDEATAVLMSYLKRICDDNPSNVRSALLTWLYKYGKIRCADGHHEAKIVGRIGVLDVGGGTSDLCIAELTCVTTREGSKMNTRQLCSYGTDRAGDCLLLHVTLKILVPMVAAWLLKEDCFESDGKLDKKVIEHWNAYLKWFRSILGNKNYFVLKSVRLARFFWFELAAHAITSVAAEEPENSAVGKPESPVAEKPESPVAEKPESPAAEKPESPAAEKSESPADKKSESPADKEPKCLVIDISDGALTNDPDSALPLRTIKEGLEDFWTFMQELRGKVKTSTFTDPCVDIPDEVKTFLDDKVADTMPSKLQWRDWMGDGKTTLRDLFRECIKEALSGTAEQMCALLMAYDCDLVLFSGKTMENRLVQEYFNDMLPIPAFALDSGKEDTATGAEYYVRRNDSEMNLHICIDGRESGPLREGEIPEEEIPEDEELFWVGPDDVPWPRNDGLSFLTTSPEVIIRRRKIASFTGSDTPCYKLIHQRGNIGENYTYDCVLKYSRITDEDGLQFYGLQLDSVKLNGIGDDLKDEWKLKVYMDNTGTSWLDTGLIKEEEED